MKRLVLIALLGACKAGDDTVEGSHAECARGGELTDCPEAERTSEGACWRLVDCGAIPLRSDDQNRFDWGNCTNRLDGLTSDRQRLVIDCIAASTCDQLQVNGSPDQPDTSMMICLLMGDQ
jgi:hypothetical protein